MSCLLLLFRMSCDDSRILRKDFVWKNVIEISEEKFINISIKDALGEVGVNKL